MGKRKRAAKAERKRREAEHDRAYEAAMSIPSRPFVLGADGSQDNAADGALDRVRDWGRYLEENHDLAVGVLDELVKNIVGSGIVTVPKPLNADGSVNEPLARQIMPLWKRWTRRADVTGELSWHDAQRLICRAWFRDGEQFIQHVVGRRRGYPFARADVPYRIELLESEFVPKDLTNEDGWRQGIRRNDWKQPIEYAVYREHPGDMLVGSAMVTSLQDVKPVPAPIMTHLKQFRRWPSTRGMSIWAPVLARIYDIKDFEESERIKNRLLASWVAAVIKSPELVGQEKTDDTGKRFISAFHGTVIDTLAAGESIEGAGPDYPMANVPEFISDQVRRIASGTGTRYSSISKHYDGNYAAQRQEMVESEGLYGMREDQFVQKVVREVYERWFTAAVLDGQIVVPATLDLELSANAEYRGPITPWIDPLKEVQADALAVAENFITREQVQIKRGMSEDQIGTEPEREPAPRAPTQLELVPDDEDAA